MKCSRIKSLLSPYRDGELSSGEREQVEQHIKECEVCSRELTEMGLVGTTLKEIKMAPVPSDMWERVRSEWPWKTKSRTPGLILRYAFLALLVLGLILLHVDLKNRKPSALLDFPEVENQFQEEVVEIYFG